MNGEIVEQWQIVKDSYPEAVVFFETDGLFFVGGADIDIIKKEFSIKCSGWVGFDFGQGRAYMQELVKRGLAVVRAGPDYVKEIHPPPDRRKELHQQRRKGKFLAIDPALLFDTETLQGLSNDRWLRRLHYEELFEQFKRCLVAGDNKGLHEYGELYVYEVDGWYELDKELTSMRLSHTLVLARAAVASACKLPCQVVQPRAWRGKTSQRRSARQTASAPTGQTIVLGQMAFDLGEIQ